MLAIRVYRNTGTKAAMGYSIVHEGSLDRREFNTAQIRELFKNGNHFVSNLELNNRGVLKLKNMNPAVRRRWYKRSMYKGVMIEHYIVITGFRQGLISYIADGVDGEVLGGVDVTLSDIASNLRVPIDDLRFYNAYLSEDEIGKTIVNIYDGRVGGYKSIVEKEFNDERIEAVKETVGKDWTARICDVNMKGISVISISHTNGTPEATLPDVIYSMLKFRGGVNHLILKPALREIGEKCFFGLKDLYSVQLSDGLYEIPAYAFSESSIESVKSIYNIKGAIREGAFFKCYKLKGGVLVVAQEIEKRAFCTTSLTLAHIECAEELGVESFANNRKLKTLELENGLLRIMHGAFRWCSSLEEVKIPETVEYIGKKAFADCKKLKRVYLSKSNGYIKIENNAFGEDAEKIYI